jgi:predicted unusual protein kinase regulating ubiquinone biosynthesis (AarF/ABC1/UbiB family)
MGQAVSMTENLMLPHLFDIFERRYDTVTKSKVKTTRTVIVSALSKQFGRCFELFGIDMYTIYIQCQ